MTIDHRAIVAGSATVAPTANVWSFAQVRENAVIEEDCTIGAGAYIGIGVTIGRGCKIQNHALIYEPTSLEKGVFVGPGAVFTNDHSPRAVNVDGTVKTSSDWQPVGVKVMEGASIGARSVCIAPVTIGRWSMVGAGSVVTTDVADFALVVGVPARQIGWVGRGGVRLKQLGELWYCPKTGETYGETSGQLRMINPEED
jgi:UDP-2-acetamido-3-amino-2,3-dideoxy-glucuronate N-acetyltransferase